MNEWKTVRLGDVCEIVMGTSPEGNTISQNTSDGIEFHQGKTCFGNLYLNESGMFTNEPVKFAEAGNVIMSVRAPVGDSNITPRKIAIGRGLCTFNTKTDFEKLFLYYYLNSQIEYLKSKSTGSTFKAVNKDVISDLKIPLPPLAEQKHIAAILDKTQKIIAEHKQMLQKYDTLIKSRFIEMFGDNPIESGKWEVETLADVCSSVVRGPFGSALKKDVFVPKSNNTVKVYEQKHAIQKSANIGTYYISQEKYEELKRFECKPGDFIMSCSGTMGEFYQLPIGCEKGIINQALCKFSLNNKIEALFFLEWMKQSIHNLETKGSGIQNVAAVSFIKQMPVFLPPLTLQNDFATFVQQIDKSKSAVQKSLEKTETLYKSLMQQYFG